MIRISPRAKKIAWLLTFVYFASYLMRINFTVMTVKICSDMSVEKSAIAVVIAGLTMTYGGGQIISGLLGDRFKPQHILSVGLFLAAVCNVTMYFCNTIPIMTAVWCVNGFAHSMLWPPIVRLMSMYLTDEEYSYSAVRVSWGSSFATIFLYTVCPLLLYIMHWRTVMIVCASAGAVIALVWTVFNRKLLASPVALADAEQNSDAAPQRVPLPKFVFMPVALIMLGIILQGVLRDGVQDWMPSYLLETFHMSEENAIFSTVILAVFSIISFAVFDFIHRKLFKNEVFCAAMIFAFAVLSAGVLYLVNIFTDMAALSMLLMAFISAGMHGINLMLITVVPKRFVKSGKVSTFSGLLNSCTYIGASISIYGFAVLAEKFGWNFTILMWVFVAAAGCGVCLAAAPLWKKFRKEYSDN